MLIQITSAAHHSHFFLETSDHITGSDLGGGAPNAPLYLYQLSCNFNAW